MHLRVIGDTDLKLINFDQRIMFTALKGVEKKMNIVFFLLLTAGKDVGYEMIMSQSLLVHTLVINAN